MMKNQSYFTDMLLRVRYSFLSAIASILTITLIFLGVLVINPVATAAPAGELHLMAMSSSIEKKVEGKADQAIGAVQRSVGEMTGASKGMAKQVKGRAKEDLGKVQGSLEKTQGKVERRVSKDIKEARADLNKANDKAGDIAQKATDAVKSLFQN
jgi:uncharacterized protein YjbJ (UPF0337 family)